MKVAILVSISDYGGSSDLPGCDLDHEIIKEIVSAAGFNIELELTGKVLVDDLKRLVSHTFRNLKAKDVEELFFYYTGHGHFGEDDFWHIPTDGTINDLTRTCFSTFELDQMIRSVSPSLTVKVVDACNSGSKYIKDKGSYEKILKAGKEGLGDCYFLYSSHQDQSSYQDGVSDFTGEIAKSIANRVGKETRYKDLIDDLSIAFKDNEHQKPYFVSQAGFVEIFFTPKKELKANLEKLVKTKSSGTTKNKLKDKLVALSKSIGNTEACNKLYLEVEEFLGENISEVTEFYKGSLSRCGYNALPSFSDLTRYIEDQGDYFFKTLYRYSPPIIKQPHFGNSFALNFRTREFRDFLGQGEVIDLYSKLTEDQKKSAKPHSFKTNVQTKYEALIADLKPTIDILSPVKIFVVPIPSRTKITVFFAICHTTYTSFDNVSIKPSQWNRINIPYNGEFKNDLNRIVIDALGSVNSYLARFE